MSSVELAQRVVETKDRQILILSGKITRIQQTYIEPVYPSQQDLSGFS